MKFRKSMFIKTAIIVSFCTTMLTSVFPLHAQEELKHSNESANTFQIETPPQNQTKALPKEADSYPFDITEETAPKDDRFTNEFINMLTTLGLMIAALYGLTWALRKFMNVRTEQANISSAIKVIDQRAINAKTTIYVLEVHGKGIVMAESVNGATLLGNIETYSLSNDDTPATASESKFSKLMTDNKHP